MSSRSTFVVIAIAVASTLIQQVGLGSGITGIKYIAGAFVGLILLLADILVFAELEASVLQPGMSIHYGLRGVAAVPQPAHGS